MAERRKILVTGGTGFFGRSLVRRLADAGHSVRILSRTAGHSRRPEVSIFRGSLLSSVDVRNAMRGCSAVFHCAAEKSDDSQMTEVNIVATKLLFTIAQDTEISFFCHLSSVGVTGLTNQRMVDENTPCNPMNFYEQTKFAAEEIASEGIRPGKVVILRPTNIFGTETLRAFVKGSLRYSVRLMLKGNENANLVYVEDVSAAAAHMLTFPISRDVETYIVSSDEEAGNTYREVQAYVASQIRSAPQPYSFSGPLWVPYYLRRLKHGRTNRGDISYSSKKLRHAGFNFEYGLYPGLADAIKRSSGQLPCAK
jgi:nucleoside-diphosphate-sugar epimerase